MNQSEADGLRDNLPVFPVEADILEWAKRKPLAPKFLIPDWLQEGEVAMLAGHGGAGKSALQLYALVCIALGRTLWGMPAQLRKVGIFSFEDCDEVMHWRLSRICALIGVGMADLAGRLFVFDGTDSDAILYRQDQFGSGTTGTYAWMKDIITTRGIEVIGIDGRADVYAGKPFDEAEIKAFIRALRRLVPRTGAVLLLAHVNKDTAVNGKTTEGYGGAATWHNSVRCRWYLRCESDGRDDGDDGDETGGLVLQLQKSNSGKCAAEIKFRWNDTAGLFVMDEDVPRTPMQRGLAEVDERMAVLDLIRDAWVANDPIPAASAGTRTASSVLAVRDGLPHSLRGKRGRQRLLQRIEQLRAGGQIVVEGIVKDNRHVREVFRAA